MKNFDILGVYRGGLPKKRGLGQFAYLRRGGLTRKRAGGGGVFFLGGGEGGWYPNAHYVYFIAFFWRQKKQWSAHMFLAICRL